MSKYTYTHIYTEKKTFLKYDDERFIVYLNEEVVPDYVPEAIIDDFDVQPVIGYKYSGDVKDGGTFIYCKEPSRNELINGIIRTIYSQTEEDAIKTHQIYFLRNDVPEDKLEEYEFEWNMFNELRLYAIETVDSWLN